MDKILSLNKVTLIITTRCNLKCRFCCEYVSQNKPFPDMTPEEEKVILAELFNIVENINTLHLSGGGEPFLHKELAELIEIAFEYKNLFDRFIIFTNSTIPISNELLKTFIRYRDKILVHASNYGIAKKQSETLYKILEENCIKHRIIKYYGNVQDFGGWVDFGKWESYGRTPGELSRVFHNCAVTRDMHGNWRTRDGKVHWCSRSQRGMELKFIPDNPDDYVDLFDNKTSREEKRNKFYLISNKKFLLACNHCSGEQGTQDETKRIPAAEQEVVEYGGSDSCKCV